MAKPAKNRNNALAMVDPKGRVVVPAGVREHIEAIQRASLRSGRPGRLFMTAITDPCVVVYPQCEWEKITGQFRDMDMADPANRAVVRLIMGLAEAVEVQASGRVVIPGVLMTHAGIKDKALFIKMPRGFEIWDPDQYQQHISKVQLPPGLKL